MHKAEPISDAPCKYYQFPANNYVIEFAHLDGTRGAFRAAWREIPDNCCFTPTEGVGPASRRASEAILTEKNRSEL